MLTRDLFAVANLLVSLKYKTQALRLKKPLSVYHPIDSFVYSML